MTYIHTPVLHFIDGNGDEHIIYPATDAAAVRGIYKMIEVSLLASRWSDRKQTVRVAGVTEYNPIIPAPAPVSHADWLLNFIRCTAQAVNELTFTCDSVPSTDVAVNVLILSPGVDE